ncbi:pectin lyase fold protein [Vibrio phage 2.275.O._10N.286.54.E11]|nr:pectin lyase fold protein [Vibrio phage 2.275.O._10N.286.54.E11]
MTTKVNNRMIDGAAVNVLDFGADPKGVSDSTTAFQSAIDSINGGKLIVPEGTYYISSTIQLRHKNITIVGYGHEYSIINNTNDTEYAFDLFPVAAQTGTVGVESLGIVSKFGIKTRYDHSTDWENNSNPIKNIRIRDCKFTGKYDDISDSDAGTPAVTDVSVLDNYGVGLQLSVTYRSDIRNNEFYRYGVGINDSGNTLGIICQNRFLKCARHIHSQRTLWAGSSFGLGAEMVIEQNDFLDATHGGGVSMFNTFGCNFRNNYMEHLDRSGSDSSPVLMYSQNASH